MSKVNYFLAKTDPQTYSINDFIKEKETFWDGVHNFQAINVIKSWEIGDRVFIYHSQSKPSKIVGLAEVVTEPEPDPNDTRGSWYAKLKLLWVYPENQQISLPKIKSAGIFSDFSLVKQSRLSTMSCPIEFVNWLQDQGLKV